MVVENINSFEREIGLKTIAEYVADGELLTVVKELGIDYSQGYYIGKPKPEIVTKPLNT